MPQPPRTAQPLFPRWVLLAVPLVAVAGLVLALVAAPADDEDADRTSSSVGAADEVTPDGVPTEEVADALDEQAAAAAASAGDEAIRLGQRVEVLAEIARGDAPARPPDWAAAGLEPGESLQGAGVGFEAQAIGERDRGRLLRWLVLAEAERARALDLGEVATGLEQVVVDLSEA